MFTGMVEELGTVQHIARGQHSAQAKIVLEHTKLGDSIAVNGICLTVTKLAPNRFSADVTHETLNRSALAQLSVGSPVNLERAMAADGRFGGHIVARHVDGVGRISNIRRDGNAIWYTIQTQPALLRFLAENVGKRLTKADIFRAVWGEDSADTMKVVANTISNLRRKMGTDCHGCDYIQTVPGGYCLPVEAGEGLP